MLTNTEQLALIAEHVKGTRLVRLEMQRQPPQVVCILYLEDRQERSFQLEIKSADVKVTVPGVGTNLTINPGLQFHETEHIK